MRENISLDNKMNDVPNCENVKKYFGKALSVHGSTAQGADWNSTQSQETRFAQLIKVIIERSDFTVLDYGCGYGAMAEYLLAQGYEFKQFFGCDILEPMIDEANRLHPDRTRFFFTTEFKQIPIVDYAVASGVFNARLQTSYDDWTKYVLNSLNSINEITKKGFSVNFLTSYSDAEKMQERLYYADPCFLFDYCKKHFSKNIALYHDYGLYDFTLIVRKNV
mgnify:CR=1 FL=1